MRGRVSRDKGLVGYFEGATPPLDCYLHENKMRILKKLFPSLFFSAEMNISNSTVGTTEQDAVIYKPQLDHGGNF